VSYGIWVEVMELETIEIKEATKEVADRRANLLSTKCWKRMI
jgi:hypothetical protein